jgi:hypothetical protein
VENNPALMQTRMTEHAHEQLSHEEVARRAYQLWEDSGRPTGEEWAHWFRAEAEMNSMRAFNPCHFERIDPRNSV